MLRHLRNIIGQYWERNVAPRLNDVGLVGVDPLDDKHRIWNRLIEAGGCFHCGIEPKAFIEGPSGGMSTNVFCARCGQGYNLTPVAHWAEMIHRDERYITEGAVDGG